MRNKLAKDVLGKEMFHLITIQLLQNTSQLIEIFKDHRPIINISDDRLKPLEDTLDWFKKNGRMR